MVIEVYSKPGCGICEAAKDKLRKMGFDYEERDIEYHTTPHDGWREDGSVEAMAAHSLYDSIPLIRVGETVHDYAGAMRELKTMRRKTK